MNHSYAMQQRRQLLGFARLLASYGCTADDDAEACNECGPCEARIWLEAHDQAKPLTPARLTSREAEVLREFPNNAEWLRPMDVGGTDGSDHSTVIMRLVQKGYVEMKEWGGHCKISWRYRRVEAALRRKAGDGQ